MSERIVPPIVYRFQQSLGLNTLQKASCDWFKPHNRAPAIERERYHKSISLDESNPELKPRCSLSQIKNPRYSEVSRLRTRIPLHRVTEHRQGSKTGRRWRVWFLLRRNTNKNATDVPELQANDCCSDAAAKPRKNQTTLIRIIFGMLWSTLLWPRTCVISLMMI